MVEIFLVTIGTAKLCATFQTNGAVTNFAPEMGSACKHVDQQSANFYGSESTPRGKAKEPAHAAQGKCRGRSRNWSACRYRAASSLLPGVKRMVLSALGIGTGLKVYEVRIPLQSPTEQSPRKSRLPKQSPRILRLVQAGSLRAITLRESRLQK